VTPSPRPIGDALRRRAAIDPSRPAILAPDEGVGLDYGQLASLAARLAALNRGGGPIALHTESRVAQAAALSAGLMAGYVVCPIDPAASADAVARLVGHAKPTLLISDRAAPGIPADLRRAPPGPLLDALPAEAEVRDPGRGGLLVYTSGSTGDPKGVLLSEANIGANVDFALDHFGYDEGWVAGSVLPLFHTFTVISDLLPMLACGGRVVIAPGFSVARLKASARAFGEHGVRSYSGVPIIFDMMMALRFSLPDSMRFAIAGAAPLSEATWRRYATTFGHPIVPCYGLTESVCFAAASPLGGVRPGAVGRPAGIEIDVVDEAGAPLAAGATGEIALRGASVIRGGYFQDGGRHSEVFAGDGWFLTGDLGRLDPEGYLYITGRKKNMLIRGGEKVYLEDVDRCLRDHPAVADCCAVRVGAGRHEDRAVAFVVTRGAALDRAAISRHVVGALGPIARLDDVVALEEIPRSASGKPLREELRRGYLSGR